MNPTQWGMVLSIGLFFGMLACLEAGFRLGSGSSKHSDLAHEGLGAIEAAVFALLGLLLGFSFAGGITRFDFRGQLIVQEANAISTAYSRVDLIAAEDQPEMRRLFREYVDARIRLFRSFPDLHAAERQLADAYQLQQRIWSLAVKATRTGPDRTPPLLLLLALNEMVNFTTARETALHTHTPTLIFLLLIILALLSGLLAGYAMAKRRGRSWFYIVVYALAIASTIYTVIELDYPRSGLIRLTSAERALDQVRNTMQ